MPSSAGPALLHRHRECARGVEENFRCQNSFFDVHESIACPGTAVITNASGDLQTYNGRGTEILQPLILRPSSAGVQIDLRLQSSPGSDGAVRFV